MCLWGSCDRLVRWIYHRDTNLTYKSNQALLSHCLSVRVYPAIPSFYCLPLPLCLSIPVELRDSPYLFIAPGLTGPYWITWPVLRNSIFANWMWIYMRYATVDPDRHYLCHRYWKIAITVTPQPTTRLDSTEKYSLIYPGISEMFHRWEISFGAYYWSHV